MRRKPVEAGAPQRRPGLPPADSRNPALLTIEQLRSQYSNEHAALARQIAEETKALEIKLEILDDVERAMRGGK